MQFTAESNNSLQFPLSLFILLSLTEKQGLGHQLPWNVLSPQYSSVGFWILVYVLHRVSILSPRRPRLKGIILIAAIMNFPDHWTWNPLFPSCSSSIFIPYVIRVSLIFLHRNMYVMWDETRWHNSLSRRDRRSLLTAVIGRPLQRRLTDCYFLETFCWDVQLGPGWVWREHIFYITRYNVSKKSAGGSSFSPSAWIL